MDASTLLFFALAGLLVMFSLLVVLLRNVVHCAMALVAALLIISIFFITLQAPMVGFSGLLALLLGGVLASMLTQAKTAAGPVSAEPFGSPEMLAKSLFGDFVLPFEIASILLLVAIIGAVVLAKQER